MKKFILFILFFVATFCINAQNQEISTLQKQINEIKAKTARVDKSLKYSYVQMTKMQDSLRIALQNNNVQLLAMQDSLKAKDKIVRNNRAFATVLFKSLKHRKNLFIKAIIVVLALLVGVCWFVIWKYKADAKKMELKFQDIMKQVHEGNEAVKSDVQMQINAERDKLDQKINEIGKKISDQDKKINDLKK